MAISGCGLRPSPCSVGFSVEIDRNDTLRLAGIASMVARFDLRERAGTGQSVTGTFFFVSSPVSVGEVGIGNGVWIGKNRTSGHANGLLDSVFKSVSRILDLVPADPVSP